MNSIKINYTYDPDHDIAYVYFVNDSKNVNTVSVDDIPEEVKGDINIDFDRSGRVAGIEVTNASHVLPWLNKN